jgi:hypothetical protein
MPLALATSGFTPPPRQRPNPIWRSPNSTHGVFNNVPVVATPGDNNPANDTAVDPTIVE